MNTVNKIIDGIEYWYDYDSNGKVIHYKDSKSYEYWQKFDEDNNLIYCKDSDGKDVYTMFNYGRSVSGKSVEEALTNLGKANPCYLFDTTKYCMCLF